MIDGLDRIDMRSIAQSFRFCRFQIARSASPELTAHQLAKVELVTWRLERQVQVCPK